MKKTRRKFLQLSAAAGAGVAIPVGTWQAFRAFASVTSPQTQLPGSQIPQFATPLPTFVTSRVDSSSYTVSIQEFQQQVLPASIYANLAPPFNRRTYLWGHQNGNQPPHWPGHTTIAHRGTPTTVKYINNLPFPGASHLEPLLTMDQTLMWADPHKTGPSNQPYKGTIPLTTHLHGKRYSLTTMARPIRGTRRMAFMARGTVPSPPRIPMRPSTNIPIPNPRSRCFSTTTPAGSPAPTSTPAWSPSTGCAISSTLVALTTPLRLPAGNQEIELTIQDRMFDTNGQLFYPDNDAADPFTHPFWAEVFFGDVVCVNGTAWPFLNVEPRRYRFRILNFSNMRFLRMWLENAANGAPAFILYL